MGARPGEGSFCFEFIVGSDVVRLPAGEGSFRGPIVVVPSELLEAYRDYTASVQALIDDVLSATSKLIADIRSKIAADTVDAAFRVFFAWLTSLKEVKDLSRTLAERVLNRGAIAFAVDKPWVKDAVEAARLDSLAVLLTVPLRPLATKLALNLNLSQPVEEALKWLYDLGGPSKGNLLDKVAELAESFLAHWESSYPSGGVLSSEQVKEYDKELQRRRVAVSDARFRLLSYLQQTADTYSRMSDAAGTTRLVAVMTAFGAVLVAICFPVTAPVLLGAAIAATGAGTAATGLELGFDAAAAGDILKWSCFALDTIDNAIVSHFCETIRLYGALVNAKYDTASVKASVSFPDSAYTGESLFVYATVENTWGYPLFASTELMAESPDGKVFWCKGGGSLIEAGAREIFALELPLKGNILGLFFGDAPGDYKLKCYVSYGPAQEYRLLAGERAVRVKGKIVEAYGWVVAWDWPAGTEKGLNSWPSGTPLSSGRGLQYLIRVTNNTYRELRDVEVRAVLPNAIVGSLDVVEFSPPIDRVADNEFTVVWRLALRPRESVVLKVAIRIDLPPGTVVEIPGLRVIVHDPETQEQVVFSTPTVATLLKATPYALSGASTIPDRPRLASPFDLRVRIRNPGTSAGGPAIATLILTRGLTCQTSLAQAVSGLTSGSEKTVFWTLTAAEAGSYCVMIELTEATGGRDLGFLQIHVNAPPEVTITSPKAGDTAVGECQVLWRATDPDGPSDVLSIDGVPPNFGPSVSREPDRS